MELPNRAARPGKHFTDAERRQVQDDFLATFIATSAFMKACRRVNVSSSCIYHWRDHDPVFAQRLAEADEEVCDNIRAELYRRAVDGWDEEAYSAGKYVGVTHKYSDKLLHLLAIARLPEFRPRIAIDAQSTVTQQVVFDTESSELASQLLTRIAGSQHASRPGMAGE